MGIFGFGVDDASGAAQGMADAGKDLAKKVLPALKSGIQMAVDMFQTISRLFRTRNLEQKMALTLENYLKTLEIKLKVQYSLHY